ncbi:MAG: hypothetical protein AB7S99_01155 [Pseudodonghicola sp.]
MRCLGLVLVVFVLISARSAGAGAWMREEGTVFLSLTGTLRQGDPDARQELSVYSEYGVSPRLTLGTDINERPGLSGHALLFARRPLSRPAARTRLAVETAVGGHHWLGRWHPMYRLTLSAGRGFTTAQGATGWLSVDAAYERRLSAPVPAYKLDATLGLSSPGRIRPILQVETAHIPGKPLFWAVTPGLTIDTGGTATWLVGLERKSAGHDTLGLKIGLWRRF